MTYLLGITYPVLILLGVAIGRAIRAEEDGDRNPFPLDEGDADDF